MMHTPLNEFEEIKTYFNTKKSHSHQKMFNVHLRKTGEHFQDGDGCKKKNIVSI